MAAASSTASVLLVALMAGSLVSGAISDRLRSRKLVYTGATLLVAGMWPVLFLVNRAFLPLLLLPLGVLVGAVPAAIFAAAAEVMPDRRLVPIALAVVMLGLNIGATTGPPLFGILVDAQGWFPAALVMAVITLMGAAVGWFAHVR